jgi:molybdopterin-guanine dinucleotide biosynthesis protein A
MSGADLYGLVLAGGRSTRMKRDKASLEYAGKPQLVRAMEIIAPLVARAFVSVRPEQLQDPQRAVYDTIADLRPGLGPIAGIHAALIKFPEHAWLVLACDLPFLNPRTLQFLLAHRCETRLATAFRSRVDARPEPLCAIYEPASRTGLEAWIGQGQTCPRKWLSQADAELLDLPEPRALDNVNTEEEYAAASNGAGTAHQQRLSVKVRYFALLREQAGRGAEALQTQARTPQELYRQLQHERGLKLAPQFLRVAVNDEFGDWDQPLADGDTIAFLPPVAGG